MTTESIHYYNTTEIDSVISIPMQSHSKPLAQIHMYLVKLEPFELILGFRYQSHYEILLVDSIFLFLRFASEVLEYFNLQVWLRQTVLYSFEEVVRI